MSGENSPQRTKLLQITRIQHEKFQQNYTNPADEVKKIRNTKAEVKKIQRPEVTNQGRPELPVRRNQDKPVVSKEINILID